MLLAAILSASILQDDPGMDDLKLKLQNAEHRARFLADELNRVRQQFPTAAQAAECPVVADRTLRQLRMSLDLQDATLEDLFSKISGHASLPLVFDPELPKGWARGERVSIKVSGLPLEAILTLVLTARLYGHIVTAKGEVLIAPHDRPKLLAEKQLTTPALIGYILSYGPIDSQAEDRKRIAELLLQLDSDDLEARDNADSQMLALGHRAFLCLETSDWKPASVEGVTRLKTIRAQLAAMRDIVESGGLQKDIRFLARLDDPQVHRRLRRILGGVRPFATDGFPEPGAKLADYLGAWWGYAQDSISWDVAKDVYVPKR